MKKPIDISFFGSSLVSSYWNGAATYYRGILKALAERGHKITFYEPDAFDRQKNRDMEDPPWAKVVVYPADSPDVVGSLLEKCRQSDVIIKASGVGVFDELLEAGVLEDRGNHRRVIFWDVDAPATLDRVHADLHDPFRELIPRYDYILTYGGGTPVTNAYGALGAKYCLPIYNALDPDTHYPVEPDSKFSADLAFLGNRLPDREARVQEFFFDVADALPNYSFLLGGSGWDNRMMPANVRYVGHVGSELHNALNSSVRAVLNVSRDSMARFGFSPATRVFEAAGAGACIITDDWEGIDQFFIPDEEILVAGSREGVMRHLEELTIARAAEIGEAARQKVLSSHTYRQRVEELEPLLESLPTRALSR